MSRDVIIDSKSVKSEYHGVILEGTYANLIGFPQRKSVRENNWAEYDGVESDLDDVEFEAKNVELLFFFPGPPELEAFYDWLIQKYSRSFEFVELGKTYELRPTQLRSYESTEGMVKVSLTCQDLTNWKRPLEEAPLGGNPEGYKINNVDVADYGVKVLQGTKDSIIKPWAVKNSIAENNHETFGPLLQKKETQAVDLKLLITSDELSDFWDKYNALWSVLCQPGALSIKNPWTQEMAFYYEKCKVDDFTTEGFVWFQFTLTLKLISK